MSKTKELVAAGHALAKELHCADSAALVRELATQLDVQLVRGNQLEQQLAAVVAENEKQQTHSEALAVDNAALREVVERMVNQFAMSGISPEEKSINPAKSLMFDAKSALFMPATDAYLAEVRAQGVEMFACSLRGEAEITRVCTFKPVQQFEEFATRADEFAAQLRQGVEHE